MRGGEAPRWFSRRILAVTGLVAYALTLSLPAHAVAAGYWGPGFRICHSFVDRRGSIYVSARHVSCRKAVRVEREYWLAPKRRKELVGPDEYNGYVRLKRFPGWRCTSGAGAGGCRKGRHEAVYNTFYP
jgi:hypothetical protein